MGGGSDAAESTSEESRQRGHRDLKKMNLRVKKLQEEAEKSGKTEGTVRLMFQDEAGFGRINKPKYCWCRRGIRPSVPCHPVREYRYAYGAVEPVTGEFFFLVMPDCNTACMNVFLEKLSEEFPEDTILLCCDRASRHKSKDMVIPSHIVLFYIPPCTPEMNPIEQIGKEIRKRGFSNRLFSSLEQVVDCLCDSITSLSPEVISRITARDWIVKSFY